MGVDQGRLLELSNAERKEGTVEVKRRTMSVAKWPGGKCPFALREA